MWTIDENVNDVNPWNVDDSNEANNVEEYLKYFPEDREFLQPDTDIGPCNFESDLDDANNFGLNKFGFPIEKEIVQARRFTGMGRYDEFSRFTKQHNIGKEDVVSIADDANKNELVLFYVA